jgi:UDP-GlcNAc:undecaprenyl-phosphate GlcNAc-1-phosphate transferase
MSPYLYQILAIAASFVISLACVPLAMRLAFKIGAVDRPDERKVHSRVMPRLGGLAIFLAFFAAMTAFSQPAGPMWGLLIGAAIIFLVGIIDDVWQLSPWLKLLGQCIAAGIAINFGIEVNFVSNPFNGPLDLGYFSLPLTFLWIVGVTNAVNLIDGLDGLAAGVSGIAALTMGIVSLLQGQVVAALAAFILVAAVGGFIPYNFYPARTFMGDGGSNFLGFTLACLAILGTVKSTALIMLFVPIVILGIPILDTFFAIIRRINNHAPILRPDKDHLHHRLMAIGMSHRRSVVIIYIISGFFALVAVGITFITDSRATLLLILLLLLVMLAAGKIGLFTGERPEPQVAEAANARKIEM